MSSGDVKQLRKNLRLNVASFVCNVAIGLWLVPYLVGQLGVAAYGLVPLAMAFTEYVSVITQSFNSSVSRFLTVELRGENSGGASAVFNSSLALMAALSLLQAAGGAAVLIHLEELVAVPVGLFTDAAWLFALTLAGFILSMLGGVFNVSMYSQNRLDLMRLNDIVRLLVRVGVTVLLFSLSGASLFNVGMGNLLAGGAAFLLSVAQWRTLSPELRIEPGKVELARLRPIAAMAGWVVVNTVGYLLLLRIDIYMVNRLIGPEACGEYAAVLQWSQLVRTAAGVFSGVVTPLGMIYYAQGEMDKLARMMALSVKLMSLALALPLALLCAFSQDILALWLGEGFRGLGGLMALQLCTLAVNLGVLPLFSINMATNRVKLPALLTIAVGIANYLLALLFVREFHLGYYGVALAGILVLTVKNALFAPWYAARLLELKQGTFFAPLANGVAAGAFCYGVALGGRSLLPPGEPVAALCCGALLLAVLALPILWWGLSREERWYVAELAPQRLRGGFRKLLLVSA